MDKKTLILKNGERKELKPKFDTMEELNDWVLDLSETERSKEETAKQISDALQYFVDQQNKKATGYMNNFRDRIQEKFEHKIRKRYFGKQSKKEILTQVHKNNEIYKQWKLYEQEIKEADMRLKKEFKKKVYEAIKRLFNKEITGHGGSDIDKEAGFHLLKLAKFFKNGNNENVDYRKITVSHGERGKKGFQYDSGGTRNGLDVVNYVKTRKEGPHKGETYVSLFNTLAIADEHDKINGAKNIDKPTSSTHIIFDLLNELGILNPKYKDQTKRFVDFVDKADSKHYQFAGADIEVGHKTLFGLHRKVPITNIYEYFEKPGRTGFEVLNEEELKKLDLKYENQKEENERKINEYRELEDRGRFGNFNNEKFIFALGKEFSGGQQISASIGNIGIFKIFENGDIYMYSPNLLPKEICGFSTNENFLNIKKIGLGDLKKILDIFEFSKFSEPELKENFLKYREEQIKTEQIKVEQEKAEGEKTEQIKKANQAKMISTESNDDFKKGKEYDGMINNIQNKVAYVTLNKEGTINGRIKVEDKKELSKYIVGDLIKVRIDTNTIEEGKAKITLSIAPIK